LNIFDVFLQTGAGVKAATKGAQIPAIYNQYFEKFYLAKAEGSGTPPVPAEKIDGTRLDQYVANLAKARDAENRKAWGDALNVYTAALTAISGSEEASFGLARSYWKLGNKRKADALFQDTLEKGTIPYPGNYAEMGDFYFYFMKDPDTAIPLYTKALSCVEAWNRGWPYKGRGQAYRGKGDLAKARADFEQALAIGESQRLDDLITECKKELATLGQ
jgi:tetratricopeptide (TPR) repeat protein